MSSADAKRQLGIKTRALKRLAADVRSYQSEKATHEAAYATAIAAGSSTEAHDVRRAREFVEEADATLRDVRQRLQENFVALQRYLGELAVSPEHAELMGDASVAEARTMLQDVAPVLGQEEAAAAASAANPRTATRVTILGDSSINEDDALWQVSEQLGAALARGGFHLVTGGYGGVSEAASFGARHASASAAAAAAPSAAAAAASASVSVTGIVSSAAFSANTPRGGAAGPNQYSTEQQNAHSLGERANLLLTQTDAVVVLGGGGLGTLSKLLLAWNSAAVEAWGGGGGGVYSENALTPPPAAAVSRPVIAWREPWENLLNTLADALHIPADLMQHITFVDGVEDAMQQLEIVKAQQQQQHDAQDGASK